MRQPAITISSLVCHTHVKMALDCLGSLRRHCCSNVKFQIHEDGTVTDEDAERLTALGHVRLIRRAEADERMAVELKNHPYALNLRKSFPLALKLFDTVAFHSGPDFAFVDSDILFLRPFANPFQFDENAQHNAVFMDDRENCYCFRSWGLFREPKIQLPARVNSGMILFRKSHYDVDALEWFLSRPAVQAIPGMREQTAWAFLGHRVSCRKFCPNHARIMREGEPDGELIAGHFTARTRSLLPEYVLKSEQAHALPKAEFKTIDGGRCRALNVARFELSRIISRFGGGNSQ